MGLEIDDYPKPKYSSVVRLKEDSFQPHWYDRVFDNEIVQSFIQRHAGKAAPKPVDECSVEDVFTLTVAVPAESDGLCGFRIETLSIPGRYESPGNIPAES